ncbi:hypothetical protein Vafri_8810 [Volvox africanus]|uniref:Uncharacterized protein n=1 Tax=Volvox africanus TaxID=51714 RepID=A0A8J4F0S5_9CHLO|nr:hypothetical protein Vafri_8810 [Volvox africanus]
MDESNNSSYCTLIPRGRESKNGLLSVDLHNRFPVSDRQVYRYEREREGFSRRRLPQEGETSHRGAAFSLRRDRPETPVALHRNVRQHRSPSRREMSPSSAARPVDLHERHARDAKCAEYLPGCALHGPSATHITSKCWLLNQLRTDQKLLAYQEGDYPTQYYSCVPGCHLHGRSSDHTTANCTSLETLHATHGRSYKTCYTQWDAADAQKAQGLSGPTAPPDAEPLLGKPLTQERANEEPPQQGAADPSAPKPTSGPDMQTSTAAEPYICPQGDRLTQPRSAMQLAITKGHGAQDDLRHYVASIGVDSRTPYIVVFQDTLNICVGWTEPQPWGDSGNVDNAAPGKLE